VEEGRREGRLQGGRKESVMAINASESERRSRERGDAVMPTPRHATNLVDGTKSAAPSPCTRRRSSSPNFDVHAGFIDA
jgi:hypothetical protein